MAINLITRTLDNIYAVGLSVIQKTMKTSAKILVAFYLSFVTSGLIEGMAPVDAEWPLAIAVVHSLLIAILLFEWCSTHADENNITSPDGSRLLTAVFPPAGIPYYFLAGYGLKNGAIKLVKSLIFFVLCAGSYLCLFYVLYPS